MRGMELTAHPGEIDSIVRCSRGIVTDGAGERDLAGQPAETDADPFAIRHQIARFRGRNPGMEHFPRHMEFIDGLLDLAREIHLEHHLRIAAVVVTDAVGAFS